MLFPEFFYSLAYLLAPKIGSIVYSQYSIVEKVSRMRASRQADLTHSEDSCKDKKLSEEGNERFIIPRTTRQAPRLGIYPLTKE